jgi:hypothetical protein
MKPLRASLFAVAAIALGVAGWGTSAAHAQGKTYPSYYGLTPSAAYYPMANPYDRDTYMNPNPFPEYRPRMYEEPAYRAGAYPPNAYAPPPAPYYGVYGYDPASPIAGYSYGGPSVYGHYGRVGRMAFRYGWW